MSGGVNEAIDKVASTPIVASVVQSSPVGILAETGILGDNAKDRLGSSKFFGNDPFGTKGKAQDRKDAIEQLKELETTTTTSRTPQTTISDSSNSSTSQTIFDPKSSQERQLEAQGLQNFQRAENVTGQQEGALGQSFNLQGQAIDSLGNILSGDAFDVSGSERRRIDNIRQSEFDVGSNEINRFLTERLGQLDADLSRRGVRGQAATQLQGDQVGIAAQSLQDRILAANRSAAGLEVSLPGQRVGLQASTANANTSLGSNQAQNAINNRLRLQTPEALQALRTERLAGGRNVSSNTSSNSSTTSGGDVTTVQKGAGAASAITQDAFAPSAQQENIAIGTQIAGTGVKIAGAVQGAPS